MRRIVKLIISIVIINLLSTAAFANGNIDIVIEDKLVDFSRLDNGKFIGEPYLFSGRTYIPLRVISEDLGYRVTWLQETQTVVMEKGETQVEVIIGSTTALVNGVRKNIDTDKNGKSRDTKVVIKNNRTYVPVRFISEAMGDKVDFRTPNTSSLKNMTVYINSNNLPVEKAKSPIINKPSVPAGAKLISDYNGYKKYAYDINLLGGGKIDTIEIHNKDSSHLGEIKGIDNSGKMFHCLVKKDYVFSYVYRLPDLSISDIQTLTYTFELFRIDE